MKKASTIFLQAVIVLIGIGALVFMLVEPHLEGRNVHASTFEIYFKDPFLACAYAASLAFFVALYQAYKILGYVRQNKTFSEATTKAVRTIKYCGMTLVAFAVGAEVYLFTSQPGDDIAGGVFMGLLMIAASGVIAIAATKFERNLQNAANVKSEINLTT